MNSATRAPPPQGAPPAYAMVTRVYRRSLRPVVVGISLLGGLWALVWGIASFRDISIDKAHAVRLEVFDIVLGVLYMTAFVIELFGLTAAALQKLPMIRIYAFLSLGAALVVSATELIRVIIHFVFKNELINECEALANGETVTTRFGIWGSETETLDDGNVDDFCNSAWSHDSFSEIAWFVVATIMSLLFASIAFSYYRQMLDPSSVVNSSRARGGVGAQPQHYNPPFAAGPYSFAYGGGGAAGAGGYAPPPGPPPAQSRAFVPQYDAAKLPEYERGGYLGETKGDAKGDEDLKGGVDPFADFDHDARSWREGSREREEGEDLNAVRRV